MLPGIYSAALFIHIHSTLSFVVSAGSAPSEDIFDVAIALTLFHALSVPLIILRYMAGLRKACKDAIVKCSCFTTVAIKRRKTKVVATRVSAAIDPISKQQAAEG